MRTRVLFVCSGNTDRSPTGEALLQFDSSYEAKSAGTLEGAPVQVTRELLEWADLVFAMQELHRKAILRILPEAKNKIRVLNIPDNYIRDSPKLIKLLIRGLRSNGIAIPYAAWAKFLEKDSRQVVLRKRSIIKGKCECGGRTVVAYDGEKVCQNCGAVYGRSNIQRRPGRDSLPYDHWSGSLNNQHKQLEIDVEKRGWG